MGNDKRKVLTIVSIFVIIILSVAIILQKSPEENTTDVLKNTIIYADYSNGTDEGGNYTLYTVNQIETAKIISNNLPLENITFFWVGYKEIYHENDYPNDDSNRVTISSGTFNTIVNSNLSSPLIYSDNNNDSKVSINDSLRINRDHMPSYIKISTLSFYFSFQGNMLNVALMSDNLWLEKG